MQDPDRASIRFQEQQTAYTCGPAALSMALEALSGAHVGEAHIAEVLGTRADIGTRQEALASYVSSLGYETIVRHTDTAWDELGELIAEGYVLIVCYWLAAEDTDHYAVVERITPDVIILQDPWTGPFSKMSRRAFEKYWYGDNDVPGRKDRWVLALRAARSAWPA